jgi:hypothetical protein
MIYRKFKNNPKFDSLFQFTVDKFEIRGSKVNTHVWCKELGTFGWFNGKGEFTQTTKLNTLFPKHLTENTQWQLRVKNYFEFYYRKHFKLKSTVEKQASKWSNDLPLNDLLIELKRREDGKYIRDQGVMFTNVRHNTQELGDYVVLLEGNKIVINSVEEHDDCTTYSAEKVCDNQYEVAYLSKQAGVWYWSPEALYHKDNNYHTTLMSEITTFGMKSVKS